MRLVSQSCSVSTVRVNSRARSTRFSQLVSTSGAASLTALKPIFFICFLHARRRPIGALKSIREDKHGLGTGKEAETGGNKRAVHPGLLRSNAASCRTKSEVFRSETANTARMPQNLWSKGRMNDRYVSAGFRLSAGSFRRASCSLRMHFAQSGQQVEPTWERI